jgi:hypothetical protein
VPARPLGLDSPLDIVWLLFWLHHQHDAVSVVSHNRQFSGSLISIFPDRKNLHYPKYCIFDADYKLVKQRVLFGGCPPQIDPTEVSWLITMCN